MHLWAYICASGCGWGPSGEKDFRKQDLEFAVESNRVFPSCPLWFHASSCSADESFLHWLHPAGTVTEDKRWTVRVERALILPVFLVCTLVLSETERETPSLQCLCVSLFWVPVFHRQTWARSSLPIAGCIWRNVCLILGECFCFTFPFCFQAHQIPEPLRVHLHVDGFLAIS